MPGVVSTPSMTRAEQITYLKSRMTQMRDHCNPGLRWSFYYCYIDDGFDLKVRVNRIDTVLWFRDIYTLWEVQAAWTEILDIFCLGDGASCPCYGL